MAPKQTRSLPVIKHTILLKPEVQDRTRLSASSIDRYEREGRFPKRLKLGRRKVGWRLADIEAWEASLSSEEAA